MRAGDESFESLRAAIEQLAAGEIADLLAEARVEARTRVRSMLSEAMAQAMLERAREELQAPVPPRREPSGSAVGPPTRPEEHREEVSPGVTDRGPGASDFGWYVYCVTEGGEPPVAAELTGVDPSQEVSTLAHGSLEAVVSRVPLDQFGEEELRARLSDMAWLERTARRHEAVLDAVREQRALVPMRLCSIYREQSGVRMMLEREREELESALDRVRGKAEWGVKVFLSDVEVADAEDDPSSSGGPGMGTAYMERRRREHGERRRAGERVEAACDAVHDRLSAVAVEGRLVPPQRPEVSGHDGDMILNGVYLVADRDTERFAETVSALTDEVAPLGLELERTGPWPAYNFIPDTIGAVW
jgi:Gas vesicle synthesis protein GvpL/GvpF